MISLLGATPIFVDIDPKTFNIDPAKLETANRKLKTENSELTPKGIIGVDLFGLPADYDSINAVAQKNGLFVIEDAAQSFGAEYHDRKACSLADVACTSFFRPNPWAVMATAGLCLQIMMIWRIK